MLTKAVGRAFDIKEENVFGAELEEQHGKYTGRLSFDVGTVGKENLLWERLGELPLVAVGDNPERDGKMLSFAMKGLLAADSPQSADFGKEGERYTRFVYGAARAAV